jgi:energy-coupling factor transporter ATP-binding protein EcfA2
LFDGDGPTFASLVTLGSNYEAIEAGLQFANGLEKFVAVVGPSGWGKSHLLRVVAAHVREAEPDCVTMSATEYLQHPRAEVGTLVLDDTHEALGNARRRTDLRVALERRVRAQRRTFLAFTMAAPSRTLTNFLPQTRHWLIARVREARDTERQALVTRMAVQSGFNLSPTLVQIIATHTQGSAHQLDGALKRLSVFGHSWLDNRACLRALGHLDPAFAHNSNWDLRMRILKLAQANAAQFRDFNPRDLAVYVMLRLACLPETVVADAVGESPSDVFRSANRVEERLRIIPEGPARIDEFVGLVLRSLMPA